MGRVGEKHYSLRNKMILWALVFILPILLLLLFSTILTTRSFEAQMQANMQQILIPFVREIDVTLDNTRRYIANKRVDMSVLRLAGGDELKALSAIQALGDGLSEDLAIHSQVDAIFLYSGENLWFVQNYNRSYARQKKAADYLTTLLRTHDATSPLFQQGYLSFEADGDYYFFIAIDLANGDRLGCWFNTDTLLEEIRASNIDGLSVVMFADRTGRMLNERFNTRSNRTLNDLLTGYFVVSEQLSSGAFTLTALLDRNVVLASFNQLYQSILFALLLATFLFALYMAFLRGSIIRPLSRLVNSIEGIKTGDFRPIPIRKDEAGEIQDVYRALNTMTNEVEALKIRVYEEKLMQQNTQMQLFQLQLRPHFFLNALNTILSYARANEYAMIQKMTLALATHCRYILYNTWFVSVEEELSYTQNYINMQSMRHDTRYHYVTRVEEKLLDQEIPILAVQIFVENALKHSRDQASEINIYTNITKAVFRGTPCLRIVIEDTGIGFSEAMLSMLNSPHVEKNVEEDRGIGIENVRQRLEILYGGNAYLAFANNKQGGARVEMLLPMERKKERMRP